MAISVRVAISAHRRSAERCGSQDAVFDPRPEITFIRRISCPARAKDPTNLLPREFLGHVRDPNIGAAIYYGLIAATNMQRKHVSPFVGALAPKLDSLAALTGVPTMQIIQDTQIVVNFIQSRAIVEELDQKIDLRRIFSRSGVDFFSRFNPKKPIEKLVRYWKTMVDTSVQMPSGIVVLYGARLQSRKMQQKLPMEYWTPAKADQ